MKIPTSSRFLCACLNLALALFLVTPGNSIRAQTPTVGVITAQPGMAEGYVLFAHVNGNGAYLIDNCGRLINSWTNSTYPPGASVYLQEDGSLMRTCRINNAEFIMGGLGGRLEHWSWEDSLMWAYNFSTPDYTQHHDIEVLPNGNVLVLATEAKRGLDPVQNGRDPSLINSNTVWSEFIVELQPIGPDSAVVVWEWHAWDHLIQDFSSGSLNFGVVADHPELIDLNFVPGIVSKDWLHANSLAYNPLLDQVVLSIANFNEFWIVDHSTTTAQAAGHTGGQRGKGGDLLYRWGNPIAYDRGDSSDQKLYFQHAPHWLGAGKPDSGKVILFNNGVGRAFSSVEILTLPESSPGDYVLNTGLPYGPPAADHTWTDSPPGNFFSKVMSSADQLANGSLFITHGADGFTTEIGTNNQEVWRYQNPVAGSMVTPQGTVPSTGSTAVFRMQRYAPDFPGFAGRTLTPGDPLEPGFDISDCLAVLTSREVAAEPMEMQIYPNPTSDKVIVRWNGLESAKILIYDAQGRLMVEENTRHHLEIDVRNWASGIYQVVSPGRFSGKILKINP